MSDLILKRGQTLFTSAVTLLAGLLFLLPGFPFGRGFFLVSALSCVLHIFIFIFFKRLTPIHFNIAHVLNFIMLGCAVHFSGGILSPFTMVFALILISGAGYDVNDRVALACGLGGYLGVVALEFFGFLTPVDITPSLVYGNWPAVLLVVLSIVGFMITAASMYKLTVKSLRTRLVNELSLKQSMIEQLSKLDAPSQIGFLVNKIVHDVRGPLGAIHSFIQMLKNENELTFDSREDCVLMLTELNRINNLLNRLINYSRPGVARKERLCPVDLIETVLAIMSFYPGAKKIRFERFFPQEQILQTKGNKEELQQVVFNLLKNSVEALENRPNPTISMRIFQSGPTISIVLRDNGAGVPKAMVGRLTHETLSTKKEGGGVGLTIAKEIVEAHSGTLDFQSHEGEGTVVTISLPIYAEPSEKIDKEQEVEN